MTILDDARDTIQEINANLSAAPSGVRPNTKFARVNRETGKVEWFERSREVTRRPAYPFFSLSLSVDPQEVEQAQAMLRAHGVPGVEFDSNGCPKIESSLQQRKIAKAMGLFSGRDGYGHQTVDGRHENSGRIRGAEMTAGREKVGRLRKELDSMPEEVSPAAVERVFAKHLS